MKLIFELIVLDIILLGLGASLMASVVLNTKAALNMLIVYALSYSFVLEGKRLHFVQKSFLYVLDFVYFIKHSD